MRRKLAAAHGAVPSRSERPSRASARRAQSQYGITIVGEVATPLVYCRRAAVAPM
jgi:hypothetical protein